MRDFLLALIWHGYLRIHIILLEDISVKGEYTVHRVYICSKLKSPFVIKQYDQLEGCFKSSHNTSSFSCSSLFWNNRIKFKKGGKVGRCQELQQLHPQTPTTESRTTQNQEGENDEDMDSNYMVKAQSISILIY